MTPFNRPRQSSPPSLPSADLALGDDPATIFRSFASPTNRLKTSRDFWIAARGDGGDENLGCDLEREVADGA